jgi:hypothetical protein
VVFLKLFLNSLPKKVWEKGSSCALSALRDRSEVRNGVRGQRDPFPVAMAV